MNEEMGECVRKCEKLTEIMEIVGVHGDLRTRDDVEVTSCLKRRKFDAASHVDFSQNSTSPSLSLTSIHIPTSSQCSNSGHVVKSIFKSLDLKTNGLETDNSASFNGGFSENLKIIDQANPVPSEHCGDLEEMESSSTTNKSKSSASIHRRAPATAKIPPQAEVEEFLSAAEKREQKRFVEKYNYDIVQDVPLEGRYRWVSLKP